MRYQTINLKDTKFPSRLKLIHDPPKKLDVMGKLLPEDELCLAVVGTRKFTSYGKEVVAVLVAELAAAGLTIVSGLARGIDTFAHKAALEAGGRTIAVLGSGIKIVYPPENMGLFKQIVQSGAVVSEFPAEMEPTYFTFPRRNRIISGMSLGTLVIEAGKKSGALITAREALEQSREVFAVPGSIFSPGSAGPNMLIEHGAHPVTSAANIVEVLDLEAAGKKRRARHKLPNTEEEETLLKLLEAGPKHIDEVVRESGLSVSTVGSTLATLEIKGLVRNMGRQEYRGV